MRLRRRIVLTLVGIIIVLAIPAGYALFSLDSVQRIARELRVRDTEATSTVGRLHTALEELQSAEDNYVVLINISQDTANLWLSTSRNTTRKVDGELARLRRRSGSSPQFVARVRAADAQWRVLR